MNGNYYRPRGYSLLPPVIKWMLILNVLFFLADMAVGQMLGINLANYLGLHYYTSSLFLPFQFITYAFLHGSLAHIFSNMFALWMFGTMIENFWGSKKFLVYYMITAIGAALTQYAFSFYEFEKINAALVAYSTHPNPVDFSLLIDKHFKFVYVYPELANEYSLFQNSYRADTGNALLNEQSIDFINQLTALKASIPTVGASGAVFGILLAFGMLFPNMEIYLYFLFPVKAKYFVFFYGAFEFYAAIQNNPSDNVAHLAHLGGMLFGFIMIKMWDKKRYDPHNF